MFKSPFMELSMRDKQKMIDPGIEPGTFSVE